MRSPERGRPASGRRWYALCLLAAIAIVSLPLTWYWWNVERLRGREIQQLRQQVASGVPLQQQVTARIAEWNLAQANTAAMREKVRALGEEPGQWQHRTITIESQRMSRVEAERYLRDLTNNQRSVFVPTVIHLKAAKANESVFSPHQGLDSADALQVTIKADLYARSAR
jgi:hypothetical protein